MHQATCNTQLFRQESTHDIQVKVSFLEIHNEEIRDLLTPGVQVNARAHTHARTHRSLISVLSLEAVVKLRDS